MKKIILTALVLTVLMTLLCGCADRSPVIDDTTVPGTTEIRETEIETEDLRTFKDYVINSKYHLSDEKTLYLCINKSGSRQVHLMSVTAEGEAYELRDSDGKTFKADTTDTAKLLRGTSEGEEYEMYFFAPKTLMGYRVKGEYTENRIALTECVAISQKEMLSLDLFPELEIHTVTSFEKLGKYRYVIGQEAYNFYFRIFSSALDGSEFDNVKLSDVEVRFTTPVCDNTSYLSFTVEGSESVTIPDGKYEWEIHGGEKLVITERAEQLDDLRNDKIYDSEEVKRLFAFFSASGQYNTPAFGKGLNYPGVKEYICSYYGENGTIAFDEYCRIAEEEFGITDFTRAEPNEDGMLSAEKKMTDKPAVAVADVVNKGDTVTVYLQFYSDKNCFVRSSSIAYTFSADGKWLGYEIVSMSLNKPYALFPNPDETVKQYEIRFDRDIYSSDGAVEYRDYVWISSEIPEYIERYSSSDGEICFFAYSKEDDRYYRVIGDGTLLLISGNYDLSYYEQSEGQKTKGTTASGYEYIIIESEYKPSDIDTTRFSADVYIKLSDKYILYLDMDDASQNRNSVINIIDSIKVIQK